MRSYWSRVGPGFNVTGVLIRREDTEIDTQGRRLHKHEAERDWSDAAGSHGQQEGGVDRSSLRALRRVPAL